MALATAIAGGFLLILRSPAPEIDWGWNFTTVFSLTIGLGILSVYALYGVCIMAGMKILADEEPFSKKDRFRGFRALVTWLTFIVIISAFLIVLQTRFSGEPGENGIPSDAGGSYPTTIY